MPAGTINIGYARKKRGRPKGQKNKPKTKQPSKMVKMVTQIVNRRINQNVENKHGAVTNLLLVNQLGTATITSAFAQSLTPSIPQNTSESGRIGNSVTVKRVTLVGYMCLNNVGLSGENPYVPSQYNVRLFIGRLKLTNSTPITANYNVLLRTGATALQFDSQDPLSLCRGINTEEWTIFYDRIHKIGVQSPANNAATFNIASGIANNDYKLNKMLKIDLTRMIKKKLLFSDSGTQPTNTGLYIFAGLVDALGSNALPASPPVLLHYDLEMSYEDA